MTLLQAQRLPRQPKIAVQPAPAIGLETYDLFVCSLGYEARSRFGLERLSSLSKESYVSAYDSRQVFSFRDNLVVAAQLGSSVQVESDAEFALHALAAIQRVCRDRAQARIAFDVSSSSRHRIASVVAALPMVASGLICDFFYFPARFSPPEQAIGPALSLAGPVSPRFVGETVDLSRPVHVLLGLGYEGRQALGAVQYLEADDVWAFFPRSIDGFFESHVREANAIILNGMEPQNIIAYRVQEAFETFLAIEGVVHSQIDRGRPVIVPFGPKVFAVAAMLVSLAYDFRVPVWRFSPGQQGFPVDAEADGTVTSLRLTLELED